MNFEICKLSEDWVFVIEAKFKQNSNVLTYSLFAGTKMYGDDVDLGSCSSSSTKELHKRSFTIGGRITAWLVFSLTRLGSLKGENMLLFV